MQLYLAGSESRIAFDDDYLPHTNTNIFMSYFYDKSTNRSLDKVSKDQGHKGLITIDSGAHSFFHKAGVSVISTFTDEEKLQFYTACYILKHKGYSKKEIVDYCNDVGFTTPSGKPVSTGLVSTSLDNIFSSNKDWENKINDYYKQDDSLKPNKSDNEEEVDYDAFFDGYVDWLHENKDRISYFVELDIQALIGMDRVWAWRDRLKKEGLLKKAILVHHSCNEDKHMKEVLKYNESGYIGLEGKIAGEFKLPYNSLLKQAYEASVRVHGFALTSQKIIEKYPFYSVDSSSWLATVRYGTTYKFSNGKMHGIQSNKKAFFKHNVDIQNINSNRGKEADEFKLKQSETAFKEMQQYVTKLWEKRGVDWHNKRFQAKYPNRDFGTLEGL